jgi:hypothetical protein
MEKQKYSFILTLEKTYQNTGFFNVKVVDDRHFGADGSAINIYVDNNPNMIVGKINRTANTNKTARIMGRVPLKTWFHLFQVKQKFKVTVLNQNSIKIECINKNTVRITIIC